MGNLTYDTEDDWHAIRKRHVGSSEVSALFSLHPFGLTRWKLWHEKRGTLPHVVDNTSVTQGQFFEPAVAAYAAEKFGIRLRKVRRYLSSDDCEGLGASVDYEEYGGGALVPTELKWSVWGDGWDWEGSDLTSAPDAYLMQVQTQLACMPNAPHGQLIAFTGNDLRRMIIPRSDAIGAAIKKAVTQFWSDVREHKEPPVDFIRDADAINDLAFRAPLRTLTLPPDAAAIFEALQDAKARAKSASEEATAAQANLIKIVLDAGPIGNDGKAVARCGKWKASLTKIADNPGKVVTAEMLGTIIGTRKGHLRTTISIVED